MRCNLTQLQDELDLLKQKLMANERKWEMIMMMQVSEFYFTPNILKYDSGSVVKPSHIHSREFEKSSFAYILHSFKL